MIAKQFTGLDYGQKIDAVVAVLGCQSSKTKAGETYIKYNLSDATGMILSAKRWNVSDEEADRASNILWAHIYGEGVRYENTLEIKLLQPLQQIPEPLHANGYIPSASIPLIELHQLLDGFVRSVKHVALHALLHEIFIDDSRMRDDFSFLPAAQERHHAFRHGLLQHTLEVADIVDAVATVQRRWGGRGRLSRDLAITGALLHDIGKLEELERYGHGARYSVSGSMLGHINQGTLRVARKIDKIKGAGIAFSKSLSDTVLHLVTAHHGKGEYGSPCAPMTAEASLIHYADQVSAEQYYFAEAGREAKSGEALYKQWKLDNGFGGKGRNIFVGAIDGLWENELDSQDMIPPSTEPVLPIPMPPLPKVPTLPVLRAGTGLGDTDCFATVRLPLIGQIAAGLPLDSANREDDIDIEACILSRYADSSFLLRIVGDSMIGDGIEDGDLIVVRQQEQADYGDIVVAWLEEGATVKRLAYQNGVIKLMSSNPNHEPIVVPEGEPLRIQGRVVAIVR